MKKAVVKAETKQLKDILLIYNN